MKVVQPGAGEVVGDAPDRRVEILSDDPAVHATWSRFGPGREGADLHVHREHTDCFYVLEGKLEVRLGPDGAPQRLEVGQLAMVPPLIVHGFGNPSDAEVLYLNFHIPGMGFADFMRGLRDGESHPYDQHEPPADGGQDPAGASIGQPREPFALVELEAGEPLEARRGALRSAFVLSGELERAAQGSWVQFEEEAEALTASSRSSLLVLDS